MNLFTKLSECISEGQSLSITLMKKGDTLTVSVLSQQKDLKDEAKNHLQPIVVSGTAAELDEGFIATIVQPIQKASGLLTNMRQYEEAIAKAESESKAKQAEKDKVEKAAKEKKEKVDKLVKKADEFEKEKKFNNAIHQLNQAIPLATDKKKEEIEKKIKDLTVKANSDTLFGDAVEVIEEDKEETTVTEETVDADADNDNEDLDNEEDE